MFIAKSYIDKIQKKYPSLLEGELHFNENDIRCVERGLGLELHSDYCNYLKLYGNGSFDEYFYIWHPFFREKGIKGFLDCTTQAEENYRSLEKNLMEPSPPYP